MSQLYLGDELVVQGILSRLPAKSLLRFMCVCKSWLSLISTPRFISSHLRNSPTNNPQALLLQWDRFIRDGQPAAIRLLHLQDDRPRTLSLDFGFESPLVNLQVVGSARGLICYAGVQDLQFLLSKIIIFNPEVGSFVPVPPPLPSLEWMFLFKGFAFHDAELDYKIMLAEENGFVYLYSLNSNSWKCISCHTTTPWGTVLSHCATFVNDCFYWLTYEDWDRGHHSMTSILVFDINSETFRRIPYPEKLSGQIQLIAGFDGSSLGVVQNLVRPRSTITHVWLMDRNGKWLKIADDVNRSPEEN